MSSVIVATLVCENLHYVAREVFGKDLDRGSGRVGLGIEVLRLKCSNSSNTCETLHAGLEGLRGETLRENQTEERQHQKQSRSRGQPVLLVYRLGHAKSSRISDFHKILMELRSKKSKETRDEIRGNDLEITVGFMN